MINDSALNFRTEIHENARNDLLETFDSNSRDCSKSLVAATVLSPPVLRV